MRKLFNTVAQGVINTSSVLRENKHVNIDVH